MLYKPIAMLLLLKNYELLPYVTMWMELEEFTLNKISEREKDKIKPKTLEMTELSQKTLEMTVELRLREGRRDANKMG